MGMADGGLKNRQGVHGPILLVEIGRQERRWRHPIQTFGVRVVQGCAASNS